MKTKIAVLGSGPVAEAHLSILSRSPVFEPVVIYGRNKDRVDFLTRKYKLMAAGSLDSAISGNDISLVDISTSNDLHYPYALASLEAGKHVILEKPAAFAGSKVEHLVEESGKRELMISICFQKRFNRSFRKTKAFLEQNYTGKFLHGETRVFMPRQSSYFKARQRSSIALAGGGVLMYHAIHDLDLLCLLLGKVKSVYGEISNTYHSMEVEDTAHLVMNFVSGGTHHFFGSTDPRLPSQTETRMVFEKGRLFFNDFGCKWSRDREPVIQRKRYGSRSLMGRISGRLYGWGSYRNILEDMSNFIRNGTTHVTSSLATAVDVHRTIEDFYSRARG